LFNRQLDATLPGNWTLPATAMSNTLHPRYLSPLVAEALRDTPVVCLLGPRQCGKSTLARSIDPRRTYITFDDSSLLALARQDPSGFVRGLPERVTLDEVQRVPELLLALKAQVDETRTAGRFILTGSANLLLLEGVQESLAGRVEIVYLQPLSEQEKQHSKTSLLQLLLEGRIKANIKGSQKPVSGAAEAIVQGGYPEPNTRSGARAQQWYKQYVNSLLQRDVTDIAGIRDTSQVGRLLELLALRTATLLNISAMATELGLRRETIEKYLGVLEHLFLVRQLPAWHRNRSKRLVKTPKVHLVDSGLACALNGLKVSDWQDHSQDFGPLLESFVVQQLICQAGWIDRDLKFYHYRDKDQVEVDLVIEQGKRVWGVEVKKSVSIQPGDGAGLAKLANQAGKAWAGGMLLYCGSNCLPLVNVPAGMAVPMEGLWGKLA
jgi:predicted AAA+ superfamily ATPase